MPPYRTSGGIADRSTAHVADRIGHIVRWLDKRQFRADDVRRTLKAKHTCRSEVAESDGVRLCPSAGIAEYVEQNGCLPCGPSCGAVWELDRGLDSVRLSANLFRGRSKTISNLAV